MRNYAIIETDRLYLRQFTLDDIPLLLLLNRDPDVLKYIHEPMLRDEDHAKEVLVNIILPQYKNRLGRWAVFIHENNEFIGWCGLKHLQEENEIDLGYRFIKKAWGKGYATEAAKAVLNYGMNTLHLKEIIGRAHVDNTASIKVLEKTGMKYHSEGIVDNCPVKIFSIKQISD